MVQGLDKTNNKQAFQHRTFKFPKDRILHDRGVVRKAHITNGLKFNWKLFPMPEKDSVKIVQTVTPKEGDIFSVVSFRKKDGSGLDIYSISDVHAENIPTEMAGKNRQFMSHTHLRHAFDSKGRTLSISGNGQETIGRFVKKWSIDSYTSNDKKLKILRHLRKIFSNGSRNFFKYKRLTVPLK